jgi:hypothetical protein
MFLQLVLVDCSQKKVIRYDQDGNYLSEQFFEFRPQSIGFIDKNTYVTETGDLGEPIIITFEHDAKNKKKVHNLIFGLNLSRFHYLPRYNNPQRILKNTHIIDIRIFPRAFTHSSDIVQEFTPGSEMQ